MYWPPGGAPGGFAAGSSDIGMTTLACPCTIIGCPCTIGCDITGCAIIGCAITGCAITGCAIVGWGAATWKVNAWPGWMPGGTCTPIICPLTWTSIVCPPGTVAATDISIMMLYAVQLLLLRSYAARAEGGSEREEWLREREVASRNDTGGFENVTGGFQNGWRGHVRRGRSH